MQTRSFLFQIDLEVRRNFACSFGYQPRFVIQSLSIELNAAGASQRAIKMVKHFSREHKFSFHASGRGKVAVLRGELIPNSS